MKGYVYFIINKINDKRYVGITTNFSSRMSHHLCALKNNNHKNLKLQNAWNKYGEQNFKIEKIIYDNITREDLRLQEKFYIEKYNSFNNGYNQTIGGEIDEGVNTRGKMSYEDYCFVYIGNKNYDGMTNRTAKYLGCDSSTIAAIKREESYLWYLEKLKEETNEFKQSYLTKFIKEMNLETQKNWIIKKTPATEDTLDIICFVSTYGRGAEKVCLDYFGLSKGFVFHFVTGKGREEIKEQYKKMTEDEICQRGEDCYNKWGITKKLKKKYQNLKDKYPNRNF